MDNYRFVLAVSGHIDHGKSMLVKSLTGIDCDRMKEEKLRKITIDIGFASIIYPDSEIIGVVDLPGHRNFIHNMLSGLSGIKAALLVIDAKESVKPQTIEHLAILSLLGICKIILVITKIDIATKDEIESACKDGIKLFDIYDIKPVDIIFVSSYTNEGVDRLKKSIYNIPIDNNSNDITDSLFRMPIDKVYEIKGYGVVVSGTPTHGSICINDNLHISQANKSVRAKDIQQHGNHVDFSSAGKRTAINIKGATKDEIKRGMIIQDKRINKSYSFFVGKVYKNRLENIYIENKKSYLVSINTSEQLCKLFIKNDIDENIVLVKSEYKLLDIINSDRFIIRSSSGDKILAGGEVVFPVTDDMKFKTFVKNISIYKDLAENSNLILSYLNWFRGGVAVDDIVYIFNKKPNYIKDTFAASNKTVEHITFRGKDFLIDKTDSEYIYEKIKSELSGKRLPEARLVSNLEIHDQLLSLYWIEQALKKNLIIKHGSLYSLYQENVSLTERELSLLQKIKTLYETKGFDTPKVNDLSDQLRENHKLIRKLLNILIEKKILVTISPDYTISKLYLDRAEKILKDEINKTGSVKTARFRDLLKTAGRKKSIEILEHFDREKITQRIDEAGSRKLFG